MINRFLFNLIVTVTLSFVVSAQNITISTENNPNEPAILMDPNNTDNLVAGANLRNYYVSHDGGETWTENILNSSYGVWGDPSFDVDVDGNFYFFHLSNPPGSAWVDRIVCQKSTNAGETWSDGSYTGLNGTKIQDKQWSIIDRSNNNIYVTWTEFDHYNSSDPSDFSRIMFSKSIDGGLTWTDAIKINEIDGDCVDEDDTVEGATPAMGPNGEIFVAWAGPNGLVFNKSTDQGVTWLNDEIEICAIPGGWDYAIPGIYRANGLPVTKCDLSGGEHNGTIYVNWTDQRNGINDTDVWLVKSTDLGETWSDPIRVNNDSAGNQQFFTWMDIDQTNGKLYFVFYDRREQTGDWTDVYMAVSEDGGATFQNIKISDSSFLPNSDVFFGDYTNITAHNGIVRPIWTRLHDGELSVLTNITPLSELLNVSTEETNLSTSPIQYPNPVDDKAYISFKLHESATVSIELLDEQGKSLLFVLKNKKLEWGKHVYPIEVQSLHLPAGLYYNKLSINGEVSMLKAIVVK